MSFLRLCCACLALGLFGPALGQSAASEGFSLSSSSAALERLSGWSEFADGNVYAPLERCVLRFEQLGSAYPVLTEPEAASRAALLLGRNLKAQRLENVQVEVLPRAEQFALLATYDYLAAGRPHRARQLFVSSGGTLRTVTGSSARNEPDPCVLEMVRFLRLWAE